MNPRALLLFAKYLGCGLLSVVLYRCTLMGFQHVIPDTRFLTYMLHGTLSLIFALVVFYLVMTRFVYPKLPRGNGLIPRYVVFLLLAFVAFCAIAWSLQDFAKLASSPAKIIAGIAVLVLGFFAQVKWIFVEKKTKERTWLTGLRNVVAAAVCGLCVYGVIAMSETIVNIYADYAGFSADETSVATEVLDTAGVPSRTTVHANIVEAGVGQGAAGVDFTWDDQWFFANPTEYNANLAKAGIVLSTVVNLESDKALNSASNASQLFTQMGFDTVSTMSYQHHTDMVDNLATMITGATDTVSFVIATKKITSSAGQEKTLIAMAIRGSYGSEWLSDFNITGTLIPGYEGDHVGFSGASIVALTALDDELKKHEGEDTVVFVTGHSRGGAVASLMTSKLDDRATQTSAADPVPGQVYAYCYATPVNTTKSQELCASYDNIFNILNPSDVVPRLPLEQWGYARYGVNYTLPRCTDQGFEASYGAMQQFYRDSFATESPSDPQDAVRIESACQELYDALPTDEGIGSLGSILALMHTFICDLNAMQVLASHYLPTYISWVFTADSSVMTIG